jgi:hypothetical protein
MINDLLKYKSQKDFDAVEYDLFEELPNGSSVWRVSVVGIKNVELKLLELTGATNRRFYAINFQDRANHRIRVRDYTTQD